MFIPLHSVPFHSVPFRSAPFRSAPFRSVKFKLSKQSLKKYKKQGPMVCFNEEKISCCNAHINYFQSVILSQVHLFSSPENKVKTFGEKGKKIRRESITITGNLEFNMESVYFQSITIRIQKDVSES